MSAPLLDRVPPQDLEAEQATLGAMLMERDAIGRALAVVGADDFYSPQHQVLFRVIAGLYREGKPADQVLVQSRLQDLGKLETVGGKSYLIALQGPAPTAAAIEFYAGRVRDKAALRALIQAGDEMKRLAFEAGDEDVAAVGARARALLDELQSDRQGIRSLESFDHRTFLAHPFPKPEPVIERMARRGEVIGLHGPPGSGKSAFVLDACRAVASCRYAVGRLACRHGAAVYVEQESAPGLLQERVRQFEEGEPLEDDAEPLIIVPFQGLRFDEEAHRAALRQIIEEVKPILLVVDTISATIGGVDMLRPEEVGPWVQWFRLLAKDFALTVLLVGHDAKWTAGEPSLKSFFGSVDWGAKCDGAFGFGRVQGCRDTFRLCATKCRWTSEADKLDLTFTIGPGPNGGLVLTSEATEETLLSLVLDEVPPGEGWTLGTGIAKCLGREPDDRTVRRALATLVERQVLDSRKTKLKGNPWEYRRRPEGGEG